MALTKVDKSVSSTPGIVDNSDATAITIDSSERVGIGTTSPLKKLNVVDATAFQAQFSGYSHASAANNARPASGSIRLGNGDGTTGLLLDYTDQGQTVGLIKNEYIADATSELRLQSPFLSFYTGTSASERMRIASDGKVFIATTSASRTTAGHEFHTDGFARHTASGDKSMELVRTSSFGEMLELFKDSGLIGVIGAYTTERMYMGSGDTGIVFAPVYDAIYPINASTPAARGDAIDLGLIGTKFNDVYANGTIGTSDRNEKNTITDSDLGLDFVKRLSPVSYKFNNGKSGRTHYGLIAQDIETVLSDINKPTTDFAGFVKGDTSEEQDGSSYGYGLRYHEFIAPLIKAIQEQQAIIEDLQKQINEVKNGN